MQLPFEGHFFQVIPNSHCRLLSAFLLWLGKFYFEETCPSIAVVLSFSIIFFSLPILRMLSVLSKLVSILLLLLSVHVKVYKIHDNIFYNIYQAYFFLCMFNSQMEFHGGLLKLSCLSIEILQLILLDYCAKPYYTHFSWVKLLLLSIKEVKPTKIFTSCIKTCYVMNNAWWT